MVLVFCAGKYLIVLSGMLVLVMTSLMLGLWGERVKERVKESERQSEGESEGGGEGSEEGSVGLRRRDLTLLFLLSFFFSFFLFSFALHSTAIL